MKDKYNINDLITGNVLMISSNDTMYNKSKEIFIFERQKENLFCFNNKNIYIEVFTEIEMTLDSDNYSNNSYYSNFDQDYIINNDSITNSDLLTDNEKITGFITKIRLLEIYNILNFERVIDSPKPEKPKQKKYETNSK